MAGHAVSRGLYRCPGGHETPCGKIVGGVTHEIEAMVSRLDEHEGCARRYVITAACLIPERT